MSTANAERQSHPTRLPPEILLLICQELAADQAFSTLYHLALTTTAVAPIALEQLYSIYDNSPAIYGTYGKRAWGTLWRSILVSTKGLTAYPYAAYLRTLSLGKNLDEDLYIMLRDKAPRDALFAPPLEDLLCLADGVTPAGRVMRTSGLPRIDNALTVGRCGQAVIEYVERLANENQAKVALSHLELNSIDAPFDLSDWCRRLGSSLSSLQCRNGTMIHGRLGAALAESCPKFTDLTLFYFITHEEDDDDHDDDDEVVLRSGQLTAFFEALRPNTLRVFEIMSRNNIAQSSIWSLSRHSQSLRSLKLSCLNRSALQALSRLSDCTQLECLTLDNDGAGKMDFIGQDMELANTLSSWIGNCSHLREFHMVNEYDALLMARDLLCTSQAALESLTLLKFALLPPGQNKLLFESLVRFKKTLRELKIGDFWDPQDAVERVSVSFLHPETPAILDSICELKELRSLSLQGATLDQDDLARIVSSLPQLERLQIMTYEILGDDDLLSFLTFRNLKLLAISSPSDFSHEALLSFVKSLDPVRQNTVEIAIAQVRRNEPWQDVELKEHMLILNGVLNIDVIRNVQGADTDDSSDSDSD